MDVWGAFTTALTAPAGDLVSTYSPPLLFDGDFTSSAGQALTVNGARGIGFQGGVNIIGPARIGVQVLVDRASSDLSGANAPYTVALTYVSQPPNSPPQTVTTRQIVPWPPTAGSLVQTTVGVNAVARIGRADAVHATVSGGLALYRITGTVQPLGFTTFRLGGHSVLFSDEYRLAASLGPASAAGPDVGAELNVPLGRRAGVVIGYRWLGGPAVDIPVTLDAIVNADQVINEVSVAEISRQFAPAPARVQLGASRIVIGVRLTP